MKNVKFHTNGSVLTITVDTSKDFGPTKPKADKVTGAFKPTGNLLVATTGGNVQVGNVKVGLNAYRPDDKAE